MNEPKLAERLLAALFRRGQRSEIIDLSRLARDCDASLVAVRRALQALEGAGLADACRLRLTLSGLAVASAALGLRRERANAARRARRPVQRPRHAA